MLREYNKFFIRSHQFLDICLTMAAFWVAYGVKKYLLPKSYRGLTADADYYILFLLLIIIWHLTFLIFNLYSSYRKKTFFHIFWETIKAVSTGGTVLILFMYFFKITDISRIMLFLFFVFNIAFLLISKGVVYKVLKAIRKRGFNFRNVLIIGSRNRARDVIEAIGEHLGAGFRVIGCLDNSPEDISKEVKHGIRVIDTINNLEKILTNRVVDELIFAMPLKIIVNADKYIALAEDMGVPVRIIPDWQLHHLMYRPGKATIIFENFMEIPTMALSTTPPNRGELLVKAVLDYSLSGFLMISLFPFFIAVAVAIKLFSKGPVIYSQERCCLNGRRFQVYKFRTMVTDADKKHAQLTEINETDGPVFKIRHDPRIIPYVGTFLRKTGLDELPQLFNVLKGEMSLVGPRPPIPDEVKKYDMWQRRRLSMKPGLTCLWQITPERNDVQFEDWMRLDLHYIDNWSLGLDFKILLLTARTVLSASGR